MTSSVDNPTMKISKGRIRAYDDAGKEVSSMSADCKHRKSGACGGCFVALWLALKVISVDDTGAKEVALKAFKQLKDA